MAIYRDGYLFVDNSTLSAFKTCKMQAMMKYGYNLQPAEQRNTPAFIGTCLHKALEQYFITEDPANAFRTLHAEYWEYAQTHVAPDDRTSRYDNIYLVLESWIRRNPPNQWPFKVSNADHVEMPFAIPLPGAPNIIYCGALDLIVQRADLADVFYVYDTKSTGRPDDRFRAQFDLGSQFSGYVWAAQQIVSPNVVGAYVNIVHRMVIPTSTGKCRSGHGTTYDVCGYLHPQHELKPVMRTPAEIEAWLLDATMIAIQWYEYFTEFIGDGSEADVADITMVPQDGKWGYQVCPLCDYKDFCHANRPVNDAQHSFEQIEWKPGPFAYESDTERIDIDDLLSNPLYSGRHTPW